MEAQFWLDVVSRIIHVATAIVLGGGSLYGLAILLPAISAVDVNTRESILAAARRYWARYVHVGILLMLLSGFYNFYRALPLHRGDGLYHGLIGIKIILALIVFFIASALVGRSARFANMRASRGKWLRVIVACVAIIVAISGYLKIRGPTLDATPAAPTAEIS